MGFISEQSLQSLDHLQTDESHVPLMYNNEPMKKFSLHSSDPTLHPEKTQIGEIETSPVFTREKDSPVRPEQIKFVTSLVFRAMKTMDNIIKAMGELKELS